METIKRERHGATGSKLHNTWTAMRARCNPNNSNGRGWKHYAGRGIRVCDEWAKFSVFHKWALENGYEKELTIDRIDNDGNYEPSNCRWATYETQNANQRRIKANNTSGLKGVVKISEDRWRSRITIDKEVLTLGVFYTAREAGLIRDNYILKNKLPHSLNY